MEFDQFDFKNVSTEELYKGLVTKALEGKHSKFEFIRNLEMLHVAKLYRRGVKQVAKMFKNMEYELLYAYKKLIQNGQDDIGMIMAIRQFGACAQYYKEEHAIAKDMISEFRCYVNSGHILQTLFGGVRPEYECVDYRKLPLKLF